jgi:membrane associated rhomboid family serine protease
MFALWMFGTVLENYWGGKKFLIFFFVTGLGAAFIHTLSGWYELHRLEGVIDTYAAGPNSLDFLTVIKKNAMYIPNEALREIDIFFTHWENNPGDPLLTSQSVGYVQQLQKFKMDVPTVGASGAVFGVLLAFGMLFPNQIILLFFAIPMKAKYFVILYGLVELYAGISNNPGDNVAHFAHLGGMLFGYLLIRYWKSKNRNYYY